MGQEALFVEAEIDEEAVLPLFADDVAIAIFPAWGAVNDLNDLI